MATLSLYIFNMLPLPHLDGSQFLKTILQLSSDDVDMERDEYDLEALQDTHYQVRRRRVRWKERVPRYIPKITTGLFVFCVCLGVIDALW